MSEIEARVKAQVLQHTARNEWVSIQTSIMRLSNWALSMSCGGLATSEDSVRASLFHQMLLTLFLDLPLPLDTETQAQSER